MIKTKIRKLLSLPPKEVGYRLHEKGCQWLEWANHAIGSSWRSNSDDPIRPDCLPDDPDAPINPDFGPFFTDTYDNAKRRDLFREFVNYPEWISQADQICQGNLHLLGHDMALPSGRDWHRDPITGEMWPEVFYTRLTNPGRSVPCDIKYVWEVNRHQYLIVLAKAYWLTGDETYAKKIVSIIEDWIRANPFHTGVNWTSSLELAVRAISWIWACVLCRDSQSFTRRFYRLLLMSLDEHGRHIRRHLSYYSSPYNHLIGEAAALHLIGSVCTRIRWAHGWAAKGWQILQSQVNHQFHPDGMCVEQATFYHHFTLGFYLQAIGIRQLNGQDVPAHVLNRIEKALDVSMHLTTPNGQVPRFGDIDNARSLYFSPVHSWDFRGLLGLGAAMFHRPDFKFQSNGISEEMLWMLSDNQLDAYRTMAEAAPTSVSEPFYHSGYFILRDTWEPDAHYLCMDCGDIAHGLHYGDIPSAAHGHADALSFDLWAHGQPVFVDGGFYTYFGDPQWHRYFRTEAAHNCVQLGPYRQARYYGRLTWHHVRHPQLSTWSSTAPLDHVWGRIQYAAGVSHDRHIWFHRQHLPFWFILDSMTVPGDPVEVRWFFHCDPNVEIVAVDENQGQLVLENNNAGVLIQWFQKARITMEKGGQGPDQGWVALGYGIRKPAWVLTLTRQMDAATMACPMIMIPWKESWKDITLSAGQWNPDQKRWFSVDVTMDHRAVAVSLTKHGNQNRLAVTGPGLTHCSRPI